MTDNNRLTDLVVSLRSHSYIPTGKPNFLYENLAPGTVMEAADAIEELMAALRPFADEASYYEGRGKHLDIGNMGQLTVADLRAARAALGENE